jgi:kynurenine formamidase
LSIPNIPKRYQIVDLSEKVEPGKAEGPLNDKRRYDIRAFSFPPGETMHQIDMESHIGTHVEAPSHFMMARHGQTAKDVSELPLDSFIGEAVFINLSKCKPHQALTPEDMKEGGVRKGDIVLLGNSPHTGDKPFVTAEAIKWLAELRIKMIGFDRSIEIEPPHEPRSLEKYFMHDHMLSNDIPMIECLANLGKLMKSRFFFLGVPAKMGGLDSFPIRAVALESIE